MPSGWPNSTNNSRITARCCLVKRKKRMIEPSKLDFLGEDRLSGFRLTRLEVFNWGTFDGKVWTLLLNGQNGLLTGDIGSGKSTLIDAITTLIVPANPVPDNEPARADTRGRTLLSCVRGHF